MRKTEKLNIPLIVYAFLYLILVDCLDRYICFKRIEKLVLNELAVTNLSWNVHVRASDIYSI